ncbi:actin filament organization protein-like protein App1-like protein [Phyllosticta capitalensis]|uniref:Actin filament organization protein-like protein App1-like protein n=1 Tax=Phyllosticta capitalensis TaxID=121624 RepID=A0ABR1YME5_9PEZI
MKRSLFSAMSKVTSLLGNKNPFAQPMDPNEHTVWLQDNTAYRPKGGNGNSWEAEFVAAFFAKNPNRTRITEMVADVADKLNLGHGDASEETIAKRLEPWTTEILPGHTVRISIGGRQEAKLGPGGSSGVSKNVIPMAAAGKETEDGDTVDSHAVGVDTHPMTTTYAEAKGWAVISDIDDTIKITGTGDIPAVLRSTFVDDPTPVDGMPALYAHLHRALNKAPFWYLSASPYNLYPFLHEFRNAHYPPGPLLLWNASWMDVSAFVLALTKEPEKYKCDKMRELHRNFPSRAFVCIGDSTQRDPEAYAQMAREFPHWVRAIFIRRVTGPGNDESKTGPDRFEKAFKGLDRGLWHVFDDPTELYARVDALVAGDPLGTGSGTGDAPPTEPESSQKRGCVVL